MPPTATPAVLPQSEAVSGPAAKPQPPALPWPHLLPALTTAALLYLSYFPVAWGGLAWVALVPILALVRSDASGRRLFFCGWAGGLLFFWSVLQWMRVADTMMYATWALLATYCALYVPLALLLTRRLDRTMGLPLTVTFPLVWTALEYVRAHLATGFGWYLLGHTQHDFLALIQVVDLAGVWAVSLLVAAVNAVLFELLYAWPRFRDFFSLNDPIDPLRRSRLATRAAAVLLLVAAALAYGGWRLGQNDFAPGPRVALVQGNLDIRLKNEAWSAEPTARNAAEAMRRHHVRLTQLAVARQPDLVVWPETSWPEEWVERFAPGTAELVPDAESAALARDMAQAWRVPLLIGVNSVVVPPEGRARRYNSAVLIDRDGRPGGSYSKMHLVPFGEYLPFRDLLPFMESFSPYDFDYSVTPGERLTRFEVAGRRFGVLICYEDTVSYLARCYPHEPAADFLFNTSNDGWFDGTAEHEEHLAIARFRAIEARRSLGRAVNMGVSAVIDPNGRVLAPRVAERGEDWEVWEVPDDGSATDLPPGHWGAFKKQAGVLLAALPIDTRTSLYSRWGDWLPAVCGLLLALGLLRPFARARRTVGAAGPVQNGRS